MNESCGISRPPTTLFIIFLEYIILSFCSVNILRTSYLNYYKWPPTWWGNLVFLPRFYRKKWNMSVCETEQGRQREPRIKTLRFPLSAEFFEALRVGVWSSTPSFCHCATANELLCTRKRESDKKKQIKFFCLEDLCL